MLSIFDIYKIGVGPSTNTLQRPSNDCGSFHQLIALESATEVVFVFGQMIPWSLAYRELNRVYHTDRATILGLLGNKPDIMIKITSANEAFFTRHRQRGEMQLSGSHAIGFNYQTDMLKKTICYKPRMKTAARHDDYRV
ncbi:hypothetical protein OH492_20220 [Vibrio chagasii]|nr:hypothetical protein [Vibrio chagasii]